MLKTRLMVAAAGIPLCLGVVWFGNWLLEAFLILLALVAFLEYVNMMRINGLRMMWVLGLGMMLNLLLGFYHAWEIRMIGLIIIFATMILSVLVYPLYTFKDLAYSFLGPVYIGFLFGYGIWLGYQTSHFLYFILVLFLAWGNDSGGYIFGRLFGKRKLTPRLSPKKTIVGSLGGIFLATAAILILNIFLKEPYQYPWLPLVGLCIIGSIGAQMGDLFVSLMKRYFGVKDAGKIIPGHGGVLDRFDSFMVILPIVYYFIQFTV